MITAFIILAIIGGGLGVYVYFSTRYFNDLFGKDSILYSRQIVTIDTRFGIGRFLEYLSMFMFSLLSNLLLHACYLILISNNPDLLAALLIFGLAVTILYISILFYFLERNLKKLNNYQYVFDPEEKSLEIMGIKKIYPSDISEIIYAMGGRGYGSLYRIVCKDGSQIILTNYLSCFDVINDFFEKNIPRTSIEINLFKHFQWIQNEVKKLNT